LLISYLRHELNSSLNALIGYSELLLEDAGSGGLYGADACLRTVLESCHELLRIFSERLSSESLRGLDGGSLTLRMRELGEQSQEPIKRIVAASAELIAIAEKLGKYGFIPDLCKIQAAGTMLQDLLDRHAGANIQPGQLAEAPLQAPELRHDSVRAHGRILIVDDNSMSRDLLRQALERQGHRVDEASGGRQALEFVTEQPYELMLLDLRMPDLSGLELLEQLSAEGILARMMIVMLSASDEMDDVVRCIDRGAEDYLIKPVNMVLLRSRVGSYLELKRLRDHYQSHRSH
jgi:CheY-like chemotaxis protein